MDNPPRHLILFTLNDNTLKH